MDYVWLAAWIFVGLYSVYVILFKTEPSDEYNKYLKQIIHISIIIFSTIMILKEINI